MRRLAVCGMALTLAAAHAAQADFVMTGAATPPQAAGQAVRAPGGPRGNDAAVGIDAGQRDDVPSAPPAVRWKMAYGFGSAVPLAFACRQIVPPAVKVTYGPGASPAVLVTWKGGDTWNHVLRDAVAPVGLHLVMTRMAVDIRK